MKPIRHLTLATAMVTVLLGGCAANETRLGEGSSMVTGSGGNAGASQQARQLIKCDRPIGTAALVEPENTASYTQYGLTSPLPLIRLIMAQSNCFRVVDRNAAAQAALMRERAMAAGGELQKGSRMGGGQMVAADYIITPSIIFQNANAGGGIGALGALLPGVAGAVAGSIKTKNLEAQVMLAVTNVRTGVQEAVAEGSARKRDIGFGGLLWAGGVAGGGGVYENTDIGKIVAAAFLDAHNKLVTQLRATTPDYMQGDHAGYYTIARVNLRGGPSTSAPVITSLPKNTPVTPTGAKQGVWWEVEAMGRTGWIHSNYITR